VNAVLGTPTTHVATITDMDQPVCSIFDTIYQIDSTRSKFIWKLYNNGVNLVIDKVTLQFEPASNNVEVVTFGPTLWTGSAPSIATIKAPWASGADPSFPGFGNTKTMELDFSVGKNLNKISFIQVSFVGSICPPYTRANVQ
jgi:hypothetical protein